MNIYDIAKLAGVSIATVSRVVNDSPRVSEKTKQKVRAVMEENNYTPNVFARGLGLDSMKTIGIVCPDVSDAYMASAVSFLEHRLREYDYDCILYCSGNEQKKKEKALELVMKKRIDALVLVGSTYAGEGEKGESVGVSFNKIFAKMGSDYKKPDATTVISRDNYRELLWPLPVTDLLFVGRAAARVLEQYGVHTIGDLAAYDREALGKLLGRQGYTLHDYASGAEHSPVIPAREQPGPKSVGNGLTFPRNLEGWTELRTAVTELSDEVAVRLRKHALKCTTVQVTIRDPSFKDICRQKRLSAPTYVSRDLTDAAIELIRASWNPKAPVRALTITAQNLVEEQDAGEQLNLFAAGAAPRRDRLEKLEKAMDGIRDRFGRDAITAASTVHRDKAEVKEDHRLPPVD